MNRCRLPQPALTLLLTLCIGLSTLAAVAQTSDSAQPSSTPSLNKPPQRIPPIAAKAQYGVLRVVAPPRVLLDGKPARLSPGSRIRGTKNLVVMPASLVGEDLKVRYTLEPLGLVHEVWILTDREIAAAPPVKSPPAAD